MVDQFKQTKRSLKESLSSIDDLISRKPASVIEQAQTELDTASKLVSILS